MGQAMKIEGVEDLRSREDLIEVARMAVYQAFRYRPQPSQSPAAHFSGQQRAQKQRAKPRSIAKPARAVASLPPRFSRPNLSPGQPLMGFVHRHVAELDPLPLQWIQYRYRQEGPARREHGARFSRAYFAQYEKAYLSGCKQGTRRMVRHLIAVALEKEARPLCNITPYGGDIDPQNWRKTYRPHWLRICAQISEIDADAMYALGVKLDGASGIA